MFALSSTLTTSSSSWMIHINTLTKCTKYSDGSDFTNSTLNPKSVSFTQQPQTSWVMSLLPMVFQWMRQRQRPFRIGQNLEKYVMSSHSLGFPIYTATSSTTTLTLLSPVPD